MIVKRAYILGLGILVVVLAACGASEESPRASSVTPAPSATFSATPDDFSTLIAMQAAATAVPSVTPWPTHTPTYTPTLTVTPSPTSTFTPEPPTSTVERPQVVTPYPTNTLRATQPKLETTVALYNGVDPIQEHYVLRRPFPRDPSNVIHDWASRSYPFGSTGGGQFNTHHGVDIQNAQGTPILATGSGWVFYAGPDDEVMFGPQNDFYGNLVVIEHNVQAPNGEKLYTLYGHMSKVQVETGQRVDQGDIIGNVGATGVALGAHLHLEVRIGDPYDYDNVYNPDLWVQPWPTYGTLAGRVYYADGSRAYNVTVTIQARDGSTDRYTFSYADDGVKPDPFLGEHYAYGDLKEGEYDVFVRIGSGGLRFKTIVTIESGRTTWLDIRLN